MKYTLLVFAFFASSLAIGQAYFQQEVNYKIDVTLDDVNNFIYGNEEFEYINNSNATLTELYIHLWPNGYKNEKTALAKQLASMGNYFLFYAQRRDIGYIDSLNFSIDGAPVLHTAYQGYEDIAVIQLPNPLAPGAKIKVATPFRVKLPSGSISRLGHIGQSYQITQWYPKPSRNPLHPAAQYPVDPDRELAVAFHAISAEQALDQTNLPEIRHRA